MLSRARSFFFMATAALFAARSAPVLMRHTVAPVVNVSSKRKRGLFNNLPHSTSPWLAATSSLRLSVAQGKRLSAKRRNQRRHKRHLKG